jgi:hypothetical protein
LSLKDLLGAENDALNAQVAALAERLAKLETQRKPRKEGVALRGAVS